MHNMTSVHDLIAMHGLGSYVWSAYGVALFLLGAATLHTVVRHRRLRREERNMERADDA